MVKILLDSLKIFYKDVNAKIGRVEGKMKEDTDDALNHRKWVRVGQQFVTSAFEINIPLNVKRSGSSWTGS